MNKVVLVTGSSRGIGKATIIEFASRGYDVVINYVDNHAEAKKTEDEIKSKYNVKTLIIETDVSDEEQVDSMIEKIIVEFGKIDVVVNNAGIVYDVEFEERTVLEWQETLNVNLIGPFLVSKYASKYMLENKKGKIINISSTNGINTCYPTSIDYDASKAGLISLTHNLALQFAPYISVNAVAPGWVNTEMNKLLEKDFLDSEKEKICLKRFAEPEEIAKLVVFLASDDADFINGEVIKMDGGVL